MPETPRWEENYSKLSLSFALAFSIGLIFQVLCNQILLLLVWHHDFNIRQMVHFILLLDSLKPNFVQLSADFPDLSPLGLMLLYDMDPGTELSHSIVQKY